MNELLSISSLELSFLPLSRELYDYPEDGYEKNLFFWIIILCVVAKLTYALNIFRNKQWKNNLEGPLLIIVLTNRLPSIAVFPKPSQFIPFSLKLLLITPFLIPKKSCLGQQNICSPFLLTYTPRNRKPVPL